MISPATSTGCTQSCMPMTPSCTKLTSTTKKCRCRHSKKQSPQLKTHGAISWRGLFGHAKTKMMTSSTPHQLAHSALKMKQSPATLSRVQNILALFCLGILTGMTTSMNFSSSQSSYTCRASKVDVESTSSSNNGTTLLILSPSKIGVCVSCLAWQFSWTRCHGHWTCPGRRFPLHPSRPLPYT